MIKSIAGFFYALFKEQVIRADKQTSVSIFISADEANLNAAVQYIDNHFAFGVTLEPVAFLR